MADTVLVAPGERYTVLVKPTESEKGVWAYHCHILSHAEKDDGMMYGMVTAFIVQ
jgi:FtsP/CotA-like multicopper oxidase with cupredoxin domain